MALSSDTLNHIVNIYYYTAIFGTIFFVLKLIMFSFFGGMSEVDADFTTEVETDTSFDFISLQSVLAFLMAFGWMGYAGITQFHFHHFPNFITAVVVGLLFMFAAAYLMFSVKKLEKTIKKDKSTAINQIGKAYTDFAPHGNGQVEIPVNEQLTVCEAVNNTENVIKAFESVKVVKVENDLLYIEKA